MGERRADNLFRDKIAEPLPPPSATPAAAPNSLGAILAALIQAAHARGLAFPEKRKEMKP